MMNPACQELQEIRFRYFAVLWALVTYFELTGNFQSILTPLGLFAVYFVLCRPGSLTAFGLLAAVYFVHIFGVMGHLNVNNLFIEGFVSLIMLLVLGFCVLTVPENGRRRAAVYGTMAPAIKIMVIGFYFFVWLAKLNRDFLDPHYSCAAFMVDKISHCRHYPFFITRVFGLPWMRTVAAWIAVVSEGSFPVLLLFRRTRPLAILWIFFFHFFIGIVPVHHLYLFSTLVFFLQFVFFSDEAVVCVDRWRRRAVVFFDKHVPSYPLRYAVIACFVYAPGAFQHSHHLRNIPFTIWLPVYLGAGFVTAAAMFKAGPAVLRPAEARPPLFPSVLAILFILVIGIAPYLGMKIAGGFDIFSNLRLREPYGNHLVFSSSMFIFDKGLIKVLDSDNLYIRRAAKYRLLYTSLGFRSLVSKAKGNFYVRILYGNKRLTLYKTPGTKDPMFQAPTWLEKKFFYYNVFNLQEHCLCH